MNELQKIAELIWCIFVLSFPFLFLVSGAVSGFIDQINLRNAWDEVLQIQREHDARERKAPGVWLCDGNGNQEFRSYENENLNV